MVCEGARPSRQLPISSRVLSVSIEVFSARGCSGRTMPTRLEVPDPA
jgi:hypothetical protein